MEEKKSPLPPAFNIVMKQKEAELLPRDDEDEKKKKGPFSNCLLFVLLAIFVFSLACFAVYTVVSVNTPAEKTNMENESTAHPLVLNERKDEMPQIDEVNFLNSLPKPKIHFEIIINGKGLTGSTEKGINKTEIVFTNTEKQKSENEFFPLTNFLKNIATAERKDNFNPEKKFVESDSKKNSSSLKPKVKTIIESWEFKKLPNDFSFKPRDPFDFFKSMRDPFDDVLDAFLPHFSTMSNGENKSDTPISQTRSPPKENRRVTVITTIKTPTLKKSNDDTKFPNSVFKDVGDLFSMVDNLFDEKAITPPVVNENKDFEVSPTFRNPRPSVLRIIPISTFHINRIRPMTPFNFKPEPYAEVFKNMEQSPLDRYKYQVKSPESNEHVNKFLSSTVEKQAKNPQKDIKSFNGESDHGSYSIEERPHFISEYPFPSISLFPKPEFNSESVKLIKNEDKSKPTTQKSIPNESFSTSTIRPIIEQENHQSDVDSAKQNRNKTDVPMTTRPWG